MLLKFGKCTSHNNICQKSITIMGFFFGFVYSVHVRVNAQSRNYVARVAYEEGIVDTLIQYPMPKRVSIYLYGEVQLLQSTCGDDWVVIHVGVKALHICKNLKLCHL